MKAGSAVLVRSPVFCLPLNFGDQGERFASGPFGRCAPHCGAESAAPPDFLGFGLTGQDGVSRSFVPVGIAVSPDWKVLGTRPL
jgi:hypothetical protein